MSTPNPNPNPNPNNSRTKYRPVLTASQITHILTLCKQEQPISAESFNVISILAPFEAKIAARAVTPAYTTAARSKANSLEALGGAAPTPEPEITKEQYWEQCYNKYRHYPASCTVEEIHAAQEHMYLHDLMSAEETAEFEARTLAQLPE